MSALPFLTPDEIDALCAPLRQRRYEGSPLQRWHAEQREARERLETERAAALSAAPAPDYLAWAAEQARAGRSRRAAIVRGHAAKRRAARLQRTPPWADPAAIEAVYAEAHRLTVETGTPHHVDHDIPLQGRLVSGLHVQGNLKILTGSENSRKGNRFEIQP